MRLFFLVTSSVSLFFSAALLAQSAVSEKITIENGLPKGMVFDMDRPATASCGRVSKRRFAAITVQNDGEPWVKINTFTAKLGLQIRRTLPNSVRRYKSKSATAASASPRKI